MKIPPFASAVALCLWLVFAPGRVAAEPASIAGEYRIVEASRPDGAGSYRGKVMIESLGAAFKVSWTLSSGESYSGPAILQNGVLGAGYGEGLTGLAIYEIKGRTLKAKWLLPATPQQVGEYEMSGAAALNGPYKFTNGVAGGVTIKPNGKIYDMFWTLPTGSFTGIGVRVGDELVAVTGTPGTNYGVAAYRGGGKQVNGVWALPGQKGLGIENIVPASAAASSAAPEVAASAGAGGGGGGGAEFSASGTEASFGGETYHLEHNVNAPGQTTSALREYLRSGETFDNYSKMVALRAYGVAGKSPYDFTRGLIQQTKKDFPKAETHEIGHDDSASTVEFLLTSGADIEYNLWHYFRTPEGVKAVQFVLRNKGLYDTSEKCKAERAAHITAWLRDVKTLAPLASEALSKTAQLDKAQNPQKSAPSAPEAGKAPGEDASADDALVAKIQVDLRAAAGIAGNFLDALKAGKLNDAAAVMSDEGLTQMKTTRKDFLAKLGQAQQTDGRLLSYAPDKKKVDFGPEAGGIYFVLAADGKCEKAVTRETLRLFRFPDGKIKMVGYNRASK